MIQSDIIFVAASVITCPQCTHGLLHELTTLHANEETITLCVGLWQSLPEFLRKNYRLAQEAKTKGLARRQEAVRDILIHLVTTKTP